MLQHELILCNPSKSNATAGKKSAVAKQLDYSSKDLVTQPDDEDEDEDDDEDDDEKFELARGENWLRITLAPPTKSVLFTQEEENHEHEMKSLSQQTTQDAPSYQASLSQTPPPPEKFVASILSSESLDTSHILEHNHTNCYICFDVTLDGNYLAVKDMRPVVEDENETNNNSVGIWRCDEQEWTALPRRLLCLLHVGDKICTNLKHRESTALTLEYQTREVSQQTQPSQSQQRQQVFYSQQSQAYDHSSQQYQTQEGMQSQDTEMAEEGDDVKEGKAKNDDDKNKLNPHDDRSVDDQGLASDNDGDDGNASAASAMEQDAHGILSEEEDAQHEQNLHVGREKTEQMNVDLTQESPGRKRLSQDRLELLLHKEDNGSGDTMDAIDKNEVHGEDGNSNGDEPVEENAGGPAHERGDEDHSSLTSDDASNDSDKTEPMSQMPSSSGPVADLPKQNVMATQEEEQEEEIANDNVDGQQSTADDAGHNEKSQNEDNTEVLLESTATKPNYADYDSDATEDPANAVDDSNATKDPNMAVDEAIAAELEASKSKVTRHDSPAGTLTEDSTEAMNANTAEAEPTKTTKTRHDVALAEKNGAESSNRELSLPLDEETQGKDLNENSNDNAVLQDIGKSQQVEAQSSHPARSVDLKVSVKKQANHAVQLDAQDIEEEDNNEQQLKCATQEDGGTQKHQAKPNAEAPDNYIANQASCQLTSSTRRGKRKASGIEEMPEVSTSARKSRRRRSSPSKDDLDNNDDAKLAKKRYSSRFEAALEDGFVNVASSNLSTHEAVILEALSTRKTLSGGVKLKIVEEVDPSTTLCVIPSDGKKNEWH